MSDPSTGGKATCFEVHEVHDCTSQRRISTSVRLYLYKRASPSALDPYSLPYRCRMRTERESATDKDIREKGFLQLNLLLAFSGRHVVQLFMYTVNAKTTLPFQRPFPKVSCYLLAV